MHALAGTVRNGLGPSEHHFLFAGMDSGQEPFRAGMSEPPCFTGSWPGTVQGQEWKLNKRTSPKALFVLGRNDPECSSIRPE